MIQSKHFSAFSFDDRHCFRKKKYLYVLEVKKQSIVKSVLTALVSPRRQPLCYCLALTFSLREKETVVVDGEINSRGKIIICATWVAATSSLVVVDNEQYTVASYYK
jgi:hypothetical protein